MIRIIPAIDILDGKCVRLTQGDYQYRKVYSDEPLEIARLFEAAGMWRLHVVDLDGARSAHVVNSEVLHQIATNTSLRIDFGGGIKSDQDLELAFECGADQVTVGSVAVKDPELFKKWLAKYGAEKIILGADVRGTELATGGWKEQTDQNLFDFLEEYHNEGINYVICTDIRRDGLLKGPSFHLYEEIREKFPDLKLIASGGVAQIEDIERLDEMGVYGVIVGKAIYEGRIELKDLADFTR